MPRTFLQLNTTHHISGDVLLQWTEEAETSSVLGSSYNILEIPIVFPMSQENLAYVWEKPCRVRKETAS